MIPQLRTDNLKDHGIDAPDAVDAEHALGRAVKVITLNARAELRQELAHTVMNTCSAEDHSGIPGFFCKVCAATIFMINEGHYA